MIEKDDLQRKHDGYWIARANFQFRSILSLLFFFALSVLILIAWAVWLKYSLELKKIEHQRAAPNLTRSLETQSQMSENNGESQRWSPERTARYIDDYLTVQAGSGETKGETAKISRSKFLDFLSSLEASGVLSAEATGAVRQLHSKLIDAGIDITVDTIKKFTSSIFGSHDKADSNLKASGMLSSLAVNVACTAHPSSVTKTEGPRVKQQEKMVCPVSLVPFGRKND
jgi:uncharacterized membrane protein YciS (DUF1049 family)